MGSHARGSRSAAPPWRAWLSLLAMKGLTTFYRRVIWAVCSLDRPIPDAAGALPVVIARLTADDLEAYRRFRPDRRSDAVARWLARGDVCFATWHAGRIVHEAWVSTGRACLPYLRCEVVLPEGTAYVDRIYTRPAYRGLGLAHCSAAQRARAYRARGYGRFVCIVAVENRAGLGLAAKTGYRPIGRSSCVRIGPWQWDRHGIRADPPLRIVRAPYHEGREGQALAGRASAGSRRRGEPA